MTDSRPRALAAVLTAMAIAACRDAGVTAPRQPTIASASVSRNSSNVLSAVVTVRVADADSVAIRVAADGDAGSTLTPAVPVTGDSAVVPVLELRARTAYELTPVAYAAQRAVTAAPQPFTTDALPADLPSYRASGTDPAPGYVAFAAGPYGIIIDNTGRVVWYRQFPNGVGLNFIAQPNGRYTVRPPAVPPGIGRWLELDALGSITRTLACGRGLSARPHDLIAESGGDYWLLCDETRAQDLSLVGGRSDAFVTGTVVQHVSASGTLLFDWSPFDHFAITDVDSSERAGARVNWTHGNAIDFDTDGNLIVSFRNLNEITKIDARTGDVIWRLGGGRNEFRVDGGPEPSFRGQHSARAFSAGGLVLLDNIGDPAQSRVERYTLDPRTRSARLIQTLGEPGVTTTIGGSVQALAGGHLLVSFGTAGRVEEYDADGRVVWRIEGHAGYVFRAQRIASLYAPGVGLTR